MNRRDFLANNAFAAGALVARSAFAAPAQYSVTVRTDRPIGLIAPDFMGLGYEISSVSRPGLLSRSNQMYVQLVRTLGTRGVIRIGGNTADYAKYSPKAAAVSSARGTVVNDAVLKDLGGFLEATGWKLIWALDLGQGTEADAIAEARIISSIAGDRLLILKETGELILAAASPQAYRPLAQAQILPPTVRALPALSDGLLYVRNSDTRNAVLVCLNLR